MEDDLTRAQHYRTLAAELRVTADKESDETRRTELMDLIAQYERLADKLVRNHR